MTLRITMSVETQEDCEEATTALRDVMGHLPRFSDLFGKVDEVEWNIKECVCDRSVQLDQGLPVDVAMASGLDLHTLRSKPSPDVQVYSASEPTTIPAQEARAAEQALMTEAVQVKRKPGRPPGSGKKSKDSMPVITHTENTQVQEITVDLPNELITDDEDLVSLISKVEHTFTPAVEEAEPTVDADDLMALLGAPEPVEEEKPVETPAGDRYEALSHEVLYQEVRKRSGDDIRAPALGIILREAVQRDKKIDSVYKFTDPMLRNLLRIADAGVMKDAAKTDVIIEAWRKVL